MENKIFEMSFLLLAVVFQPKASASICQLNSVVLNTTSGHFNSPNYPSLYPPDSLKIWKIVAPADKVIDLYFTAFKLEPASPHCGKRCGCDYVKLRNKCEDSVPVATYCGDFAKPIRSSSNVLWVEFRSNYAINADGFEAIYRAALKCTGEKPISCVKNGRPYCCSRYASVCFNGTSTRTHCPRDSDPVSHTYCCTKNGSPSCCSSGKPVNCVFCYARPGKYCPVNRPACTVQLCGQQQYNLMLSRCKEMIGNHSTCILGTQCTRPPSPPPPRYVRCAFCYAKPGKICPSTNRPRCTVELCGQKTYDVLTTKCKNSIGNHATCTIFHNCYPPPKSSSMKLKPMLLVAAMVSLLFTVSHYPM